MSSDMIIILRIGSLRSPPPIRLRHWTHLRCEGSEGSEGSKGSEGGGGALQAQILKKRGAAGAAGCVEGLCPHRGNDSLHFVRRSAPSPTAVTDSLDFQVADAPLQIQFA